MRNVEPRILIIDIAISFSSYEFSANLMKSKRFIRGHLNGDFPKRKKSRKRKFALKCVSYEII